MEFDWERTLPFFYVDRCIIIKLFKNVLKEEQIGNIIPINEGCRTTNYIIESRNEEKKYILKIFFSNEQNYKKEINLFNRLKISTVLVPKICKFSSDIDIGNKEYAIYEYIEGISLSNAIKNGYVINSNFIKQIAKNLASVHMHKFDNVGFFDDNLEVKSKLPPLNSWYKSFMGENFRKRLGCNVIDKIDGIVGKYKEVLCSLDEEVRLVHGDFQGTNILINNENCLAGIVDWEFAMAGHPLADIGQFFRYEEHFNENLISIFEEEYSIHSDYKLIENWYKISKLRDLINLIQLMNNENEMPNKYKNIKEIIMKNLQQF